MVEITGQFNQPFLTEKEDTWVLPVNVFLTTEELVKVLNKSKDGKINIFIKPQ